MVGCDLGAELGDTRLDLPFGEVDRTGPRPVYETWFRPYLRARRSKSRFVKSLTLTSG
jgi:hypothetical protein